MEKNRWRVLTPLLLVVVAFSARSISLQWSTLPYNIDGLSELRVAQDILSTGHLDFSSSTSHSESYVVDLPLFGLLMTYISSFLGVDVVNSSLLVTAMIGSVAVSLGYLLLRQHWCSHRASVCSGLFLALAGSFVFTTGCVWKETLGFMLILIVLYSYPLRQSVNHRLLMTVPLPLLVFTHHYAAIVTFVILTFAMLIGLSRRPRIPSLTRTEYMDVLTLLSSWGLAIIYYDAVSLPYLDYLSPKSDLYLYLAVASLVLMIGIRMSVRDRPLTRLPLGLVVPASGAVLMVINYVHPIFAGMSPPGILIAVPFMAYLFLVVPAWPGARLALASRGSLKDLSLAAILGPLSLIIFAFVRSADVTSHEIIFRTFDFLMPAFAVMIGLGFTGIINIKGRRRLGMLAGISFVIICASTLPVAYQTQELFGVQNQTYEFEYDAVQWFSENGIDSYTSDQRLGETGWRLFDIEYARGLPYDLREGIALESSSFFVTEGQWTYNGAQEFPFGVVVVDQVTLDSVADGGSVLYVGGPMDNQLVLFRTGD